MGGSIGGIELPRSVELFIGAAGIFLSFSIFAVLQEDVYKKAYAFHEVLQVHLLCAHHGARDQRAVALAGMSSLGKSGLAIPHKDIFNSGVSQMLAMAASNEALRYASYPTQVLGKSCKMVPVMAGGFVLGGKRYSLLEYVQVALITIGVSIFNFGGKKKKGGAVDKPIGLCPSLCVAPDGHVHGRPAGQGEGDDEGLNPMVDPKKAKPTMHESMFYTNASGLIVAIILALVTGHLFSGAKFCRAPAVPLRDRDLFPLLRRRAELCVLHADPVRPARAHDGHDHAQDLLHPLLRLPQPRQLAQRHAVGGLPWFPRPPRRHCP